ncbi:hypothetical protein COLO4_08572 [Corchorus olitorius]|uniref:Uncharacterized protein n=1 Tax=Corchorus olitorius TaxID=93759 RepID=A0A1R3KFB2_9ROSI|nr:hypothetical protein COLO4_08572 [Corchorus olitorius]
MRCLYKRTRDNQKLILTHPVFWKPNKLVLLFSALKIQQDKVPGAGRVLREIESFHTQILNWRQTLHDNVFGHRNFGVRCEQVASYWLLTGLST